MPNSVPNSSNKEINKTEEEEGPQETNLEKELKKIKLKKVEKDQNAGFDKMMQGSDKNFLQNALSNAIRMRRNNLHMHDEEEDDDDEDDWD